MLDSIPFEVLENIAFWTANDYIDGHYCCSLSPPFPAIFLTNSHIYKQLIFYIDEHQQACKSISLSVRLFEAHFNKEAYERRFNLTLAPAELAEEYKKRIRILRRIKKIAPYNVEDLWTVLLMIYEDDGKNMRQLLAAGVEQWVRAILRHHYLDPSSVDGQGWPIETEAIQLSLAIFSFVSTPESVVLISPQEISSLLDLCDLFNGATHRYSVAHSPIAYFNDDQNRNDPHLPHHTLANFGPVVVSQPCDVQHFGQTLKLAAPTAVESTICIAHLLMERHDIPNWPNTPKNRAEAVAMGRDGPTEEDHEENNLHRRQALGSATPHAGSDRERANYSRLPEPRTGSLRFDPDFWRMYSVQWTCNPTNEAKRRPRECWYNTVFSPDLLGGSWFGRFMVPYFGDFTNMAQMHPEVPPQLQVAPHPMAFDLREYISSQTSQHLSYGDARNAYMPQGIDPGRGHGAYETHGALHVSDPAVGEPGNGSTRHKTYDSIRPGVQVPQVPPELMPAVPEHSSRRETGSRPTDDAMDLDDDKYPDLDIIFTGMTDYIRGLAWGGFKVYGRVRKCDGLITFVRVPFDEEIGQGRWVFTGYLRGSTTIVGQWRETGAVIQEVGYGGVFMITKVGDTWGLIRQSAGGPPPS